VDAWNAEETRKTGIILKSIEISVAMLPVQADKEFSEECRDSRGCIMDIK